MLFAELETKVETCELLPELDDVAHIIDGMTLIQMVRVCGMISFGEFANKLLSILINVLKHASRVDVVFDQYNEISIKNDERKARRVSESREVRVQKGTTPLPKQWDKFFKKTTNKKNVSDFLVKHWIEAGKKS